jgi:hypothetical protein
MPDTETVEGFAKAVYKNFPGRYQIACGTCYEDASCEIPRNVTVPEAIDHAAHAFFDKGWRWTDRPICPVCIRRQAAPIGHKKKVT